MAYWILLPTLCSISTYVLTVAVAFRKNIGGVPPVIVEGPPLEYLYIAHRTLSFPCHATGLPPPRYEWYKDGQKLEAHVRARKDGASNETGRMLLQTWPETTEGSYQCKAVNDWGEAFSNISIVQEAVLEVNPGGRRIQAVNKTVVEGNPLSLPCDGHVYSVPEANAIWYVSSCSERCRQRQKIFSSERISVHESGCLVFSHVTMDDISQGRYFICEYSNPVLGKAIRSSIYRLYIADNPYLQRREPSLYFYSETPRMALVGDGITMSCYFSGRPAPAVRWWKSKGPLPRNRFTVTNFGRQLTIQDIHYKDGGYYECQGTNTAGDSRVTRMMLTVEARPHIRHAPRSRNVSVGDDVMFICKASGSPLPEITWYLNDKRLDAFQEDGKEAYSSFDSPVRWTLGSERNTLKLYDLQVSDSMTVHCNASNVHGYHLQGAYVRVTEDNETQLEVENENPTIGSLFGRKGRHRVDDQKRRKRKKSHKERRDRLSNTIEQGLLTMNEVKRAQMEVLQKLFEDLRSHVDRRLDEVVAEMVKLKLEIRSNTKKNEL